MKIYSVMLSPIFYLGWIIQPTLEGFEVYDRLDRSHYVGRFFPTVEEACAYIGDQALENLT